MLSDGMKINADKHNISQQLRNRTHKAAWRTAGVISSALYLRSVIYKDGIIHMRVQVAGHTLANIDLGCECERSEDAPQANIESAPEYN